MKYVAGGIAAETKEINFSDFDMDLRLNPSTKDVTRITNSESVKQAIRNLVCTNIYERLFNSTLGGNVTHYLFENISPLTAYMIKSEVSNAINNFEKRVELLNVTVDGDPDALGYNVTIFYRLKNSTRQDKLTVLLERVR